MLDTLLQTIKEMKKEMAAFNGGASSSFEFSDGGPVGQDRIARQQPTPVIKVLRDAVSLSQDEENIMSASFSSSV